MSETTNLHLFERDPNTEGSAFFSVKEMLNDNWDKIDAAHGAMNTRMTSAEASIALPGVLLYTGSYTGTGGTLSNKTISTTKKPYLVYVFPSDGGGGIICARPSTQASRAWDGTYTSDSLKVSVVWSNTGVTLTGNKTGLNTSGETYNWIALCKVD